MDIIRGLQMQHNNNMQQELNLTFYTTPYYFESNGSQLSDLSYDDTIEGGTPDNYSDIFCPSVSYQNISYLNVSCEVDLEFSIPLYGERERLTTQLT
jgi:hypothetical protein